MKARWHRYWFEMPALPARMFLLRVVLFGMLGADLWLMMLEHAPRYGAGGFNVPQIDALARVLPLPSTALVTALWLLGGFLALRAALGVAVRASVVALALIYFGVYLWSQADSYQHHYLVGLLLVIASFVPEEVWTPPAPAKTSTSAPPPTSWALRLVYVQLALLYFWAAVTKITPVWLDGSTLAQFLRSPGALGALETLMQTFGFTLDDGYVFAAWATVLLELGAAVLYLTRRYTVLGLLALPAFHFSVEMFEFDIEWFSYYMVALNVVLLTPDRWMRRLDAPLAAARRRLAAWRARLPDTAAGGPAMGVALVSATACAGLATLAPLEGTTELAVGVFLVVAAAQWPWDAAAATRSPGRGVVHLGLAGAMLATLYGSTVPYDYYRLWGGDLRRRGDPAAAVARYERANALAGDAPARHLTLATLYESLGRPDDARAALQEDVRRFERALRLDRERARTTGAVVGPIFDLAERHDGLAERLGRLARLLRREGQRDEAERLERQALTHREDAKAAFRRGLERDPGNARGRRGLARLAD